MNQPAALFPNETYVEGLEKAEATVVESLYNEFRQPVSRAVEAAGGSYADGNTFFRVALMQTARMVNKGTYPADTPIYAWLQALAIAHYNDWKAEKREALPMAPEAEVTEDTPAAEFQPDAAPTLEQEEEVQAAATEDAPHPDPNSAPDGEAGKKEQEEPVPVAIDPQLLPEPAAMREFRAFVQTKRKYTRLEKNEKLEWREKALKSAENEADTEGTHLIVPLLDPHFHEIWSACEAIEKRLASNQIPDSGDNKTIRYAFLAFMVLTIGYAAYTWIFRDRTPEEVYNNNFNPPASIVEDIRARYANDSIPPQWPIACTEAFERADGFYKQRNWREAGAELATMMDDSLTVCQSDALFYLMIVGLELERPELTLECMSKIEDIERFGEDAYWYMAMAYVQIAAKDPTGKDRARRAVQRTLSNTEKPERRQQAEKMLKDLE